ncbi:MAG: CoA pyrophosphatase [Tepidamorphaceae bacterium]|nr:CoA pyrophosphatase [Rhodobiaceae bacterium]
MDVSTQDQPATALDFTIEGVRARLKAGLRTHAPDGVHDDDQAPDCGDHDLNPGTPPGFLAKSKRRAAVMVPLIERAGAVNVILTTRTEHLPNHAGQISFPGGKIDDTDDGPLAAALREAHEEIGLDPAMADPAGYLDLYETSTGFRIVPTVAVIAPAFIPVPEPGEVANVFEVPLSFLMDPANHQRGSREWQGRPRYFYAMPFGEHYIWGATAGIIRNLYNRTHRDRMLG